MADHKGREFLRSSILTVIAANPGVRAGQVIGELSGSGLLLCDVLSGVAKYIRSGLIDNKGDELRLSPIGRWVLTGSALPVLYRVEIDSGNRWLSVTGDVPAIVALRALYGNRLVAACDDKRHYLMIDDAVAARGRLLADAASDLVRETIAEPVSSYRRIVPVLSEVENEKAESAGAACV